MTQGSNEQQQFAVYYYKSPFHTETQEPWVRHTGESIGATYIYHSSNADMLTGAARGAATMLINYSRDPYVTHGDDHLERPPGSHRHLLMKDPDTGNICGIYNIEKVRLDGEVTRRLADD